MKKYFKRVLRNLCLILMFPSLVYSQKLTINEERYLSLKEDLQKYITSNNDLDINDDKIKIFLSKMVEIDQFVRKELNPFNPSNSDKKQNYINYWKETDYLSCSQLESILKVNYWIKISVFGIKSDQNAWLLIQHCDHKPEFQKKILKRLENLLDSKETSLTNFAYLYDRVAKSEKKPQRYGTQGICLGKGKTNIYQLEDEKNVDNFRKKVGLMPLKEYIEILEKNCP